MEHELIVGIEKTKFKPKDSENEIEGATFYVTAPFSPGRGEGNRTDRFFMTVEKMSTLAFTPAVGQTIELLFNKWGKVETLRLIDDTFDIE